MKMTHKLEPRKNITENKCHTYKKEFKLKHYSNKRNYMQDSFLNTTPSIQKYNSGILLIIIYYYTLCKGSRWALGEM
jgi:5'-3' exonuclease